MLFSSFVFGDLKVYASNWRNDHKTRECKSRADIHASTIIRTKDSKANGAVFINETALNINNRDQCVEICCLTPRCTVSVYEEKEGGNCYLFDCGEGEDFRCRFTDHSYYTVAILQKPIENSEERELYSNRIMPVESHEDDLIQLKKQRTEQTRERYFPRPVLTTGKTPTTRISTTQRPKCGRFQFSCHSDGECIAIYNVCDGIPQCEDQSDEDPRGCTNFILAPNHRREERVDEVAQTTSTLSTAFSSPSTLGSTTANTITKEIELSATVSDPKIAKARYDVLHVDSSRVKKIIAQQAHETTGAIWALALGINVLVIFLIVIVFRFKALRRKSELWRSLQTNECDNDDDEDQFSGLRL
ncbi:low-density lipoprotein receptor-related protein 11-like [Artemia franciscana]